jgi:hypothetical protein
MVYESTSFFPCFVFAMAVERGRIWRGRNPSKRRNRNPSKMRKGERSRSRKRVVAAGGGAGRRGKAV